MIDISEYDESGRDRSPHIVLHDTRTPTLLNKTIMPDTIINDEFFSDRCTSVPFENFAIPAKKQDCKEVFDMTGNVASLHDATNTSAKSASRWTVNCEMPDAHVKDFSPTMRAYQQQVLELGLRIMRLLGRTLDLATPEDGHDALAKSCAAAVCHHRLLHYPPLTDYHKEVSIGAHVDYGFITLLTQDMVGGLQVRFIGKKFCEHDDLKYSVSEWRCALVVGGS